MGLAEEEMFFRALELPVDERADFLSRECAGDDDLRKNVEALLELDESDSALVDSPCMTSRDFMPTIARSNSSCSMPSLTRRSSFVSTSKVSWARGAVVPA